ncbi:MAG: hypothetical protein V2I40_08140 [Desulfobacteraceae bacterium]|jgi:hypothetical protein|nr:hypothetical protein [Desulfobacteraceae bacterium]
MAMQAFLHQLYLSIDAVLMYFYRLTGIPILDYFIGTLFLSLVAVVLGELSVSLALRFNRSYIDGLSAEADRLEKLSFEAHQAGNEAGYRGLNKAATDAWGKKFFTMAAYSAGILWPIPFALGWMQIRFNDVEFLLGFPLSLFLGDTVGYLFSFFPIYILARILFKYLRPWLPYFRGVQRMLDAANRPADRV